MEHWDAIRRRVSEGLLGSCTEEQVSHILSGRFSRDPLGWSEEGRGGLSKQRIYLKNKGRIEASDFKKTKGNDTYSQYAQRIIDKTCEKELDWSIFEKQEPNFDGASGT